MAKSTKRKTKKQARPSKKKVRPIGITIIAILGFAVSILLVMTGLFIMGISPIVGDVFTSTIFDDTGISFDPARIGNAVAILGMIPLGAGVIGLGAFYMLYRMTKKALNVVTVIGFASILINIALGGVIAIIMWSAILLYLWNHKKLFK